MLTFYIKHNNIPAPEVTRAESEKDMERFNNNGYDEMNGLYKSRYYANKAKSDNEVVVKVCGGFKIMSVYEYEDWKKQR